MAYKCFNCNKGIVWGHKVSHAKNRTNRIFKPNLQIKRVKIGNLMKRVKLCTACIKRVRKDQKDAAAEVAAASA